MSEHGYDEWKTTEPYVPEQEAAVYDDCDHLQFLDADGICTRCGEDCRAVK